MVFAFLEVSTDSKVFFLVFFPFVIFLFLVLYVVELPSFSLFFFHGGYILLFFFFYIFIYGDLLSPFLLVCLPVGLFVFFCSCCFFVLCRQPARGPIHARTAANFYALCFCGELCLISFFRPQNARRIFKTVLAVGDPSSSFHAIS